MLKDKMRWLSYTEVLPDELIQAVQEGKDPDCAEVQAILAVADEAEREEQARAWMLRMQHMPLPADLAAREPNDYPAISALLPPEAACEWPAPHDMPDRLRAAWAGRLSGCLLGIPVEGWPSQKIAAFVKATGQDPCKGYLRSDVGQEARDRFDVCDEDAATPYDRQRFCWINNMQHFPVDDDTNYTVAALRLLDRFGRGFTPDNVAENMLYGIPALHVCTAERMAYRNLLNMEPLHRCAWLLNPYREWIGAQIRADFFGYINPGRPHEAARMAYNDACVTHVRNGIYAEMYVAALISLAPCGMDMLHTVQNAMLQIPPQSRLHCELAQLLDIYRSGCTYADCLAVLHARYDERKWFWWGHAVPNALLVTAIVLWHGGDHSRAIGQAVLAGFDTDCNAATVGSVAALHTGRVAPQWLRGIAPTLQTSVHGYERFALDELVQRTLAHTLL